VDERPVAGEHLINIQRDEAARGSRPQARLRVATAISAISSARRARSGGPLPRLRVTGSTPANWENPAGPKSRLAQAGQKAELGTDAIRYLYRMQIEAGNSVGTCAGQILNYG
jgi:hypothetical protein